MVVFRELRITNTGKEIVLDAEVRKNSVYNNVYITKVIIGTHKDYEEGATNGIDITNYLEKENSLVYTEDGVTKYKCKRVYGILNNGIIKMSAPEYDFDLEDDLIFVYIETTPFDNPECPDLPCNMINRLTIGVTLNLANVYNQFMQYINELNHSSCSDKIPQNLIDFILRYNALLLAIDAGHYIKAIEFYKKWFMGRDYNIPSNCGCNG